VAASNPLRRRMQAKTSDTPETCAGRRLRD
jgi:hypothetical protein